MSDADGALRLAEYFPGSGVALSDSERWPTMDAEGARRLDALVRHPLAPAWVHRAGDRLTVDAIGRAAVPLPTEGWLDEHLATARRLLAYRDAPHALERLEDFPLISRDDLLDDIAAFVPLDADLTQLVHGTSSGSTGHALQIPDHVEEVARTFHLLVRLVRDQGIDWRPEPTRMALAHVVSQRQAFTYASLISGFGQATMARLNLSPAHWPSVDERNRFLIDQAPQVFSGNPASMEELLHPQLVAGLRPLALFSGAFELGAPLREALSSAYGCPVFDIYGLHETRPIAVSIDGGPLFVLDRRVLVEEIDGELVVTAGENPLLPLVRYRTGDYGRLVTIDGRQAIADLQGREATRFVAADGSQVGSVDLTQQLQAHGAHGWTVHQQRDGSLDVVVVAGDAPAIERSLAALLGQPTRLAQVATLAALGEGKPRRYMSEARVG